MKAIREMLKYIRLHPMLWSFGLIVPPVAALGANLAFAYGLALYTDELVKPDALFARVTVIMLVTLATLVVSTLIEDTTRYLFAIFVVKTENNIRQELFASLVRARYQELGALNRGEWLTRYNTDTGMATLLISWDMFSVLWPVVLGVGYLIALFSAHWVIGLVMFALTTIVIFLNLFFVRRFAILEKAGLEAKETFTRMVDSVVRGKMSVRQMSAGKTVAEKIQDAATQMAKNENAKVQLSAIRACSLEFFATVCGSLTAPLACILAALGWMPLASVVLVAQLCRYLIMFTSGAGVAWTNFRLHGVSYTRIQEVLSLHGEGAATGETLLTQGTAPVLECQNVTISYGDHEIVKDLNLTIGHGEIVALIGPSGSGKSSIVKALLRLIDYSGQIKLYGHDIASIPLQALRQNIAFVPEHSELFDGSVLENLLYTRPGASPDMLDTALHSAALDDMDIAAREAGTGGSKLSGGQRQRVAVARALLKDSPLIILDEPTAALDPKSERRVLETLAGLKRQGKGVLIISHREATMNVADKCVAIAVQE
jgi:ABC-type multidrug transport system fused ATPase/permease subunit